MIAPKLHMNSHWMVPNKVCIFKFWLEIKAVCDCKTNLSLVPFLRNCQHDWIQTVHEWSLKVLCTRLTCLVGFFIMLVHWNNNMLVDGFLHSDTLSWFQDNQSLLLFLNVACLAEKQHISILKVFGFTQPGLEPTIYRTKGMPTITSLMQLKVKGTY